MTQHIGHQAKVEVIPDLSRRAVLRVHISTLLQGLDGTLPFPSEELRKIPDYQIISVEVTGLAGWVNVVLYHPSLPPVKTGHNLPDLSEALEPQKNLHYGGWNTSVQNGWESWGHSVVPLPLPLKTSGFEFQGRRDQRLPEALEDTLFKASKMMSQARETEVTEESPTAEIKSLQDQATCDHKDSWVSRGVMLPYRQCSKCGKTENLPVS